jgi:hypothetical protein
MICRISENDSLIGAIEVAILGIGWWPIMHPHHPGESLVKSIYAV